MLASFFTFYQRHDFYDSFIVYHATDTYYGSYSYFKSSTSSGCMVPGFSNLIFQT